jgi:hypothetical protein
MADVLREVLERRALIALELRCAEIRAAPDDVPSTKGLR